MARMLNSLLGRLLIGTGVPLALFASVIVLAVLAMQRLADAPPAQDAARLMLDPANRAKSEFTRMQLARRGGWVLDDPQEEVDYRLAAASIDRRLTELAERASGDPSRRNAVTAIREMLGRWERQADEARASLPPSGGSEKAAVRARAAQAAATSRAIHVALDALISLEAEELHRLTADVAGRTRRTQLSIFIASLFSAAIAVVFALLVTRSITRPVQKLRSASGDLLAGRFATIRPEGPTEVAQLIQHFNHMGLTLTSEVSELRDDTDRYRQYIGSTAHILWTTDADGRPTDDLPTWRAFTGQSPEQTAGDGWMEAIHPADTARFRTAWHASLAGGTTFDAEFRIRGAAGDYRHYLCRAVPIRDGGGRVREWLGACTDVTDRHREAELTRETEKAIVASRAKTEFLTRMSHELRTPLNAVIGMSKMLAAERFGPLTDKQADYLRDITQAGEHLLSLINDMLDLAKVEAGRMEFRPEPIEVEPFLAELAVLLRPLASEKGVRFELAPVPSGGLTTDPGRLRQVLVNLGSNAIKFTPGGGSVCLGSRWVSACALDAKAADPADAAALRVDVVDTGVGIARGDLNAIWDEFSQLRPAPAGSQGTGLGLPLARRLVGLLSGRIDVQSEVGRGSTFTIVIPRTPAGMARPSSAEIDLTGAEQRVALVIENYAPTRRLLVDWLAELALTVVEAADLTGGIEAARLHQPDLIVLDIVIPGGDGWQLLREIKTEARLADVPVMVVTVNDYRIPPDAPEVQAYLIKPVSREVLQRQVRSIVRGLPRPTSDSSMRMKKQTDTPA